MGKIRETLRSLNPTLLTQAEALIRLSETIAVHAPSSFPTATSHGREHLQTVEKIADLFLPDELLAALNSHEIFYLLLSIYYHDLGMVGEESEFSSPEGREQIRRQHAVSVGVKIIENWEQLGFQNENAARTLADVCRGHRPRKDDDGNASWLEFDQIRAIGPSTSIRLRLVAALIYSIDELHLGDDRAERRLQNWIKLENDESRRHWMRHNEIRGPVESADGGLQFDAIVKTKICEQDLRRNVFAKAFGAVADLNRQLQSEGLKISVPIPTIQWDRTELWKLSVVTSSEVDNGTTLENLKQVLCNCFAEYRDELFSLKELCYEIGNSDDEAKPKIENIVDQLRSLGILKSESDSGFYLATNQSAVTQIGSLLRKADELDVLFGGKFQGNHEFDLHCKRFGDRYVEHQVIPTLRAFYGVNPDVHEVDKKLVILLKASPSAARFAIELKPIQSDLVKRRLLATTVVAGFSRDCMQNPALILDKSIRDAFRKIAVEFGQNFERSVDFYEELALIGGFDENKLTEIFDYSDEWKNEATKGISGETTIKMSQTFDSGQPIATTSFFYFYLAGLRSGNFVELKCNHDSSIVFDTTKLAESAPASRIPDEPPTSFMVGPGQAQRLPVVDLRCKPSFDPRSKVLTLSAVELSDHENGEFPMIVSFPNPDLAEEGVSKINFSLTWPRLTVGQILALKSCKEPEDGGRVPEIRVSMFKTGQGFATLELNGKTFSGTCSKFPDELIEKLAAWDADLPAPWFIKSEHETLILGAALDEIKSVMNRIRKELESEKRQIPSFKMIHQGEVERPYREEYLGFFPGLEMSPPTMEPNAEFSNEEIEHMWNDRKAAFKLETHLREDSAQIAVDFRKWADGDGKWPISTDSNLPHFHQAKTVFSFIRKPMVDRFWYLEAPNEVVLRPTSRKEKLETEMRYWKSVGDEPREQLVKEKLERLETALLSTVEKKEPRSIVNVPKTKPPKPKGVDRKAKKKRMRKLAQRQKKQLKRKGK